MYAVFGRIISTLLRNIHWNNVTQGEWLLYMLQKIVMENDVLFILFNWDTKVYPKVPGQCS